MIVDTKKNLPDLWKQLYQSIEYSDRFLFLHHSEKPLTIEKTHIGTLRLGRLIKPLAGLLRHLFPP